MILRCIDGAIHAEGNLFDEDGNMTLELDKNQYVQYVSIDMVCEWLTTKAEWCDYSHDEIDFDSLAKNLRKYFSESK